MCDAQKSWERHIPQRWGQIRPLEGATREVNLRSPGHFDDALIFVPLVEPDIYGSAKDRIVEPNQRRFLIEHPAIAQIIDTVVIIGMMTQPYTSWIAHLKDGWLGNSAKTMLDAIGRENIPKKLHVIKGSRTLESMEFEVLRALRELGLEIETLMVATNPDSHTIKVKSDGTFQMVRERI